MIGKSGSGRGTRAEMSRARWRKSSRSTANGACVEVAEFYDVIGVRDSKDRTGPVLTFAPESWTAFLDAVRGDTFGPR